MFNSSYLIPTSLLPLKQILDSPKNSRRRAESIFNYKPSKARTKWAVDLHDGRCPLPIQGVIVEPITRYTFTTEYGNVEFDFKNGSKQATGDYDGAELIHFDEFNVEA